jgi:hypothetical protein
MRVHRATFSAIGFAPNPNLRDGLMVQDPLRIWQLDTFFPEPPPYTMRSSLLTGPRPFWGSFIQTPIHKLYGIVSEACQQAGRFGFLQDSPLACGGFEHQLNGCLQIGVVRNSYRDLQPDEIVAVGPIDHLTAEQTHRIKTHRKSP